MKADRFLNNIQKGGVYFFLWALLLTFLFIMGWILYDSIMKGFYL